VHVLLQLRVVAKEPMQDLHAELELSIVVPVYNNARTLDELIDRIVRVVDDLGLDTEIIFVDDGSTDSSAQLLQDRGRLDPRIRVLRLARNFGSQAALCCGFDHVRGKRTVCLDADLENFPEDIPALLHALERGHDLACAVREKRRSSWLRRRLPSALLNAYVQRSTGKNVRDIGCGMRAMDSTLAQGLAAEGEKRRLLSPLLIERSRSFVEVPVRHGVNPWPGGHTFLSLLAIASDFFLLSSGRPFLVTGVFSAILACLGAFVIVAAWLRGEFGLALAGSIIAIGAALGALMSLIGEYVQRIYLLQQGRPFYALVADGNPNGTAAHQTPGNR